MKYIKYHSGDSFKINIKISLSHGILLVFATFSSSNFATADLPFYDPILYSLKPEAALHAPVMNTAAVMYHSIKLDSGKTLNYKVTTGHITTRPTDNGPAASVFYTAYTAETDKPNTRALTFFFGGGWNGPGTPMQLNYWGPMRLFNNTGTAESPVFPLAPAADTLLDQSDLIYIDRPMVGYSQAILPAKNRDFDSMEGDSDVLRDFISEYIRLNGKQASPKYLYSGSQGGERSAILANKLFAAHISLDGIILHSPSTMNYNASCDDNINDVTNDRKPSHHCADYIPTLAATSYYYGIAGKGMTFEHFMSDVNNFVDNTYIPQELAALREEKELPEKTVLKLLSITGFSRESLEEFPYFWTFRDPKMTYIDAANLKCASYNDTSPDCPYQPNDMRRRKDAPGALGFNGNLYTRLENFFAQSLGYTSRVKFTCWDGPELCEKTSPPTEKITLKRMPKSILTSCPTGDRRCTTRSYAC